MNNFNMAIQADMAAAAYRDWRQDKRRRRIPSDHYLETMSDREFQLNFRHIYLIEFLAHSL